MKYTIPKGKLSYFHFPKLHFNKDILECSVIFFDDCLLSKTELPCTNNLIGYSFGLGPNSKTYCIQWTPDPKTGYIKLFSSIGNHLADVFPNEEVNIISILDRQRDKVVTTIKTRVEGAKVEAFSQLSYEFNKIPKYGIVLGPQLSTESDVDTNIFLKIK